MNTPCCNMFAKQLEDALDRRRLNDLGRSIGFTRRLRVITPFRLIVALITTLACFKVESIADLLRGFNYQNGTSTAYKAFYNRLARPSFPVLMQKVFCHLLESLATQTLEFDEDSPLARFRDIIIQDGSSFALKNTLETTFPGRFNTIEPAAVEIHLTYSARRDEAIRATVTADSVSERGELPPFETFSGCLALFDRGYPSLELFLGIDQAQGSFICRLTTGYKPRVHGVFLQGRYQGLDKPIPLDTFLAQNPGQTHDLSITFAKNKHKTRFRLVVVPNTSNRKKKKDLWIRLCTNLPANEFAVELVGTLYCFRWQIELVFKEWKSYANLHKFDTGNAAIAEGLIWASLCAATVKRFIAHATQRVTKLPVSTRRVAMCIAHFLPEMMKLLIEIRSRKLRKICHDAVDFIVGNALRSNPKRDREKGRLRAGLHTFSQLK